jgi:hypothetical protein
VSDLGPETLFARLDALITWAKHEKETSAQASPTPVDLLPIASFWHEGRPHAVIHCLTPEHGEDLTRLVGEGIVHLQPECVCVVMEGENPERGTCLLGFASDRHTVVEARVFYSTVRNVPVFGPTEPAPLAVAELHPLALGLMTPFNRRSSGEAGDVEALARTLPRHRIEDVSTGRVFGP